MADAIYKQCLDAVAAAIQGLSLTGVTDTTQVITEWKPWDQVRFEAPITVHPAKDDLRTLAGTCGKDDIGYGCQVTMAHSREEESSALLTRRTEWREEIRGAFHNKRLAAVSSVMKCTVQLSTRDGPVLWPRSFQSSNYLIHALIVWCWSREARS